MNNGRYNSKDKGDEAGQDIPAVAYVRMSTDHQKYSTENQLDIIRNYATARGLQILRVFEDSGRSGLRLDGRKALQNLMAEVRTGRRISRPFWSMTSAAGAGFRMLMKGPTTSMSAHAPGSGSTTAASSSRMTAASAPTC